MLCPFCEQQDTKYKCPKCSLSYCSIACFKSAAHKSLDDEKVKEDRTIAEATDVANEEKTNEQTQHGNESDRFARILEDPMIQYYLKQPALQFHLLTLVKILQDVQLTGEHNTDTRREIMNLKLSSLRAGGDEANELVEEFVQKVLEIALKE